MLEKSGNIVINRLKKNRFWILPILLIVSAILISRLYLVFQHFPYYSYIDEGHVLLWVESFYGERAPKYIFYGPLMFYLISFVDFIVALARELSFSNALEYMTVGSDPRFYNDYRSPHLFYIGKILSIAAYCFSIVLVFKIFHRFSRNEWASIIVAAVFMLQPWLISVSVLIQPEIYIVTIFLMFVFHASKEVEVTDNSGRLGYRFVPVYSVLFALLACLKIYTVIFSIFPLALFFRNGLTFEAVKKSVLYIVLLATITLLLYVPYRNPAEIWQVISYATTVYASKEFTETLPAHLLGDSMYWSSLLSILGMLTVLVFYRLHILARIYLALIILSFFYFSSHPFANPRNIILLTVAPLFFSRDVYCWLSEKNGGRGLFIGIFGVSALAMGWFSLPVTEKNDTRQSPEVLGVLNSGDPVYIDSSLQIASFGRENIFYLAENSHSDAPLSPKYYYITSRSDFKGTRNAACTKKIALAGQGPVDLTWYMDSPGLAIYECLNNSATL